jgi:hypothetical protein
MTDEKKNTHFSSVSFSARRRSISSAASSATVL